MRRTLAPARRLMRNPADQRVESVYVSIVASTKRTGRLRVTEVIALSPAAIAGTIKVGDYLLAVDGRAIDQTTNLDETLNYKIGRRVSLTVSSSADGAAKREVVVRPVNAATERGLFYRQWVERNREYVSKASNGRLGYAHMFDMCLQLADAVAHRSRCRELRERRSRDRYSQQQRRLRECVRDRRAGAA